MFNFFKKKTFIGNSIYEINFYVKKMIKFQQYMPKIVLVQNSL